MSFTESRIRETRCHEPRAQQRCPALRLSVMRRSVRPGAGVLGITSTCSEWWLTLDRHIEAQMRRSRNIRLWLLYRSLWWLCTDCLPKSIHYQTISSHLLQLDKLVNQDTKCSVYLCGNSHYVERNQRLLYLGSSFSIGAHYLPRSAILALQSPLSAANGGSCGRWGG